jgi:pyruvate dehydrogenase E1 component alpha subunit
MPEKTVFEHSITYRQILDADGHIDRDLLESPDLSRLTDMYRDMVRARRLDEKSLNLQRQGRLGTYAPYKGQEAAQVASVEALDSDDLIVPSYREGAALIKRGVPIERTFLYWGGDERGSVGMKSHNAFPVSIPVGSQPIHAVGAIRGEQVQGGYDAFAITYFGDGATSEGDMMEAMNMAGVWETPVLFFCQNNQWAISVPRDQQTASETLAQKAAGFGFDGLQVDGNDPLAVYHAVSEARENCIENQEPFFIEAITYRRGDHTTADDASRYRSEEEIKRWERLDPLKRTRQFLEEEGGWDDEKQTKLEDRVDEEIDEAIDRYETFEDPDPKDIFQYTFKEMTPQLEEQYDELVQELTSE